MGADGLLIEVHPNPEKAYSDGAQSLSIPEFENMMTGLGPYLRLWQESRGA
jgi:3-deoxy-7-phosphoheptulonate synthase